MLTLFKTGIIVLCTIVISACQPKAEQQEPNTQEAMQQETSTQETMQKESAAGMVFVGDLEGQQFTIATGNEYDLFMEVHEAFNNMDVEGLWRHSADTIDFYTSSGGVTPLTRNGMSQMFAGLDSVSWELRAVIPVKVQGSDRVNILLDSWETVYPKEGAMNRKKLFERFVFEDDKIVAVHQWEAQVAANEN